MRSALALIAVLLTACAHRVRESDGPGFEAAIERRAAPTAASFRGLSVAADGTVWVSGTQGCVLRSGDGGETFEDVSVPGADALDFRDVHGFDARTAVVLSAGSPGVIYRTEDEGRHWIEVFRDERPEIFLDALDFDGRRGLAFGDPIDGRFALLESPDLGRTWREAPPSSRPAARAGEAGFAASGTCLISSPGVFMIGTGGNVEGATDPASRVLISRDGGTTWSDVEVPLARSAGAGIFSLCRYDERRVVVVGGDYLAPDDRTSNFAVSCDDGVTWRRGATPPHGYRSVVIRHVVDGRAFLLAAGINGADASFDGGETWTRISEEEINVLASAPRSGVVFAAGPRGALYRIAFEPVSREAGE